MFIAGCNTGYGRVHSQRIDIKEPLAVQLHARKGCIVYFQFKKIRIATSDNKIRTHGLKPGWYKLTRIMKKNSTQTIGIFKIDE
jgi:hypothetical protein